MLYGMRLWIGYDNSYIINDFENTICKLKYKTYQWEDSGYPRMLCTGY